MLEELKAQYRTSLPEKVNTIKGLLDELREGKPNAQAELRLLAHALHGSGTTFGFPEITAAARKVELASPAQLLPSLALLIRAMLAAAATEAADKPAPRYLLVVEDDPDISNLLQVVITDKSPQYHVVVAATGAAAMAQLSRHPYALIVLDLVLPDFDGRVLLRELRAAVPAPIPVFVLSGVERPAIREECLALGARRFFNKPFDPEALASAIDSELRTPQGTTAEPEAAADTGPARFRVAGKRVLVAEDDMLLAGIIKHRLAREGLTIEHVSTGADALGALGSGRYDLVILDVKMPVHDGFEVLSHIRGKYSDRDVPVIMLTAMGSEKDVVRGYDMGANDYIVKPFSPVELVARVKSLLKADAQR